MQAKFVPGPLLIQLEMTEEEAKNLMAVSEWSSCIRASLREEGIEFSSFNVACLMRSINETLAKVLEKP